MEIEGWTQTLGAGPLLGIAAAAIAVILLLVIKFRLHAFLTLILVSLGTAFATGIPANEIVNVLVGSFGSTLGSVALLVGLGAMLGKLIEHSGGATVLADTMIDIFGEKRAPLALGVASLLMGFPMFFDAGLVVMLPIVFAVAARLGGPVLLYAFPTAVAFSVMHVFVPPHPGPVAAAEAYGANLGLVLAIGLVIAVPTFYVTGILWGKYCAKKFGFTVNAGSLFGAETDEDVKNPPSVLTVVLVLLLPMVLIFMNTGLDFLRAAGTVSEEATAYQVARAFGSSPVALLISVLVALVVLGFRRGETGNALEKIVDSSLGPICSVVLITGAGGMFGGVLRTSGIGDALSNTLEGLGVPLILAAYLIAVILRVAQGSATVALVTTAGLMAPAIAAQGLSAGQIAALTVATAAGSVFASHVNDSGFWLVGRLFNMDVATTLRTWTVQQALESLMGFVLAAGFFLVL